MSESLPEGVSRKDFEELKGAVTDLATALQSLRDAETSREKQTAREDVKDARADLDQLAKEMGVSPAKLREAADNARREEEKERLRPILLELLDEEIADKPDEAGGEESPDQSTEENGDTPADPASPPAPPEDTAPEQQHWSERTIGGLLK